VYLEAVLIYRPLEAHLELKLGDQGAVDVSVVEHGQNHLELSGDRLRVQLLGVGVLELLVRLVVQRLQGDGHARSPLGILKVL
jgi:hypothetical protein